MHDNSESIAHLPFIFMGKLHQSFQNLASFFQNSINTNKVKINDSDFDVKQVGIVVKLMSKFIKNMKEHIEDSSVPKEIPPFARKFFIEQDGGKIVALAPSTTDQKMDAKTATATKGGKRKSDGTDPALKKKKRETSDKSLTMGIFHVKKGTPVSKALPDKSKLKDGASICLDFCCHERKCKYISSAQMENTTRTGRTYLTKTSSCSCSTWTAPVSCGLTRRP
jgi:hypothetical protein